MCLSLETWDLARCEAEIKTRQEILPTLVGWLYPLVVLDEIDKIASRMDDITNGRVRRDITEPNTSHIIEDRHETL